MGQALFWELSWESAVTRQSPFFKVWPLFCQ